MRGGPGRARTSNQAVMSAVTAPENSTILGFSAQVRRRLFLFGNGVSLVIYWSSVVEDGTSEHNASRFRTGRHSPFTRERS